MNGANPTAQRPLHEVDSLADLMEIAANDIETVVADSVSPEMWIWVYREPGDGLYLACLAGAVMLRRPPEGGPDGPCAD